VIRQLPAGIDYSISKIEYRTHSWRELLTHAHNQDVVEPGVCSVPVSKTGATTKIALLRDELLDGEIYYRLREAQTVIEKLRPLTAIPSVGMLM
jgi:hypothetical protein